VQALDHISLQIVADQIVTVLGANGAGKTTLLRCLGSVVAPDRGEILLDGEVLRRDRVNLRRRILFLPDFPVTYGHMTPLHHIAMVLRLYEKDQTGIAGRVSQVLGSFDLLPLIDTPVARLSRGQVYKTAVSALFLADPELWLLDEPFASGMDPAGIMYFKQECRAAAARGRTVIYSTQLLDIAEKFSDRVCILQNGTIKFFDSVEQIRQQTEQPQRSLEEIFSHLREVAQ
jgi:ABC-type multidrug transport system ATPase subunit